MPDRPFPAGQPDLSGCPFFVPGDLSAREIEVLDLVKRGCTDKSIALILGISPTTVRFHVQNAARKLGGRSRTETVVIALARHLIQFDLMIA